FGAQAGNDQASLTDRRIARFAAIVSAAQNGAADRRLRLLRARRKRQSSRRAAEQRDELAAAHHSITSSAVYHGGPSCPQISVLMLCSLITGPQSFIWSSRNLRCASGPPICIVISIASMRLLIAGSRSVSASALLKRSTMSRGVRPAVNVPHQA